jgi:murein DD-endopeptidase MepM/ murein hydrolase activator NlpD
MPNAPREYRLGIHEGIDFYDGYNCVSIPRGTPVLAAKTGVVIRADHDYQDITVEEMDALLARCQQQGYTDPAALDRLRGQQVWLDHGHGIVTRYAHLLAVEEGIEKGMVVEAGQVLGYVGNSGTPEGVTDPNLENHLHFEIRVGPTYLAEGLSPADTRRLCEKAFSP